MKIAVLYQGVILLICGIGLVLIKTISYGFYGPIVFGMGFALMVPGAIRVYRYFYWSRPQNKALYEARRKEEEISLKDERKIMLRQKSGHITYQIMFFVLLAVNVIFTFIGVDLLVVRVLWALWIFQYVCGVAVYRNLAKKF